MNNENIPLPIMAQLEGDVELNDDQRAVLSKELQEHLFAMGHLYSSLQKNEPLAREMVRNILYLGEARIAKVAKFTQIELDSEKEREERYSRMRALNERIRELEQELGQSGTVSQTQAHLKLLAQGVESWWRKEGLGYSRELYFKESGAIKVELSCLGTGDFLILDSDTPVSDKEAKRLWVQRLKEKGLVLADSNRSDVEVVDCDQSHAVLNAMVTSRFPSARIISSTNHKDWRTGTMILRSLDVYIQDPDDIFPTKD